MVDILICVTVVIPYVGCPTTMSLKFTPQHMLIDENVSKSFWTGCLEWELQMVQLPLGTIILLFC